MNAQREGLARGGPGATGGSRRIGLWIVGGRGAIATCTVYGLHGLVQGLVEPIGLATARPPLDDLDWVDFGDLVLGGCEVRQGSLDRGAAELVRMGILPAELVAACSGPAAAYDARLVPGVLDGPDLGGTDLHPESARLSAIAPRDQVRAVRGQLARFREQERLERVVVVNLASTEAWRETPAAAASTSTLQAALERGDSLPASVVYALAAFEERCPYLNFTPNVGASWPALRALAEARGVPHCGNDGKTGETLVKTALAPMFAHRALRVLAWQGYNMLGNRDGEVLSEPLHKRAKVRNKDEALRSLLSDSPDLHSHVGIDYVPSLHDWKTAWDFIHFQGFLGVKMSLQFTWAGCDSALATPLVLDLARLLERAARRGEVGVLDYTAAYFKSPLGGGTHDFHRQFAALLEHLQRSR